MLPALPFPFLQGPDLIDLSGGPIFMPARQDEEEEPQLALSFRLALFRVFSEQKVHLTAKVCRQWNLPFTC